MQQLMQPAEVTVQVAVRVAVPDTKAIVQVVILPVPVVAAAVALPVFTVIILAQEVPAAAVEAAEAAAG